MIFILGLFLINPLFAEAKSLYGKACDLGGEDSFSACQRYKILNEAGIK